MISHHVTSLSHAFFIILKEKEKKKKNKIKRKIDKRKMLGPKRSMTLGAQAPRLNILANTSKI